MSQTPSRPARRTFLFAAGATAGATGAAALAAVALRDAAPPPSIDTTDKRDGAGYAESAHVRNYYRTTRI